MAHGLNEDQINDLKQVFVTFDMDADGTINSYELGEVMRATGQNPTEAEVNAMIKKLDRDGNGSIQWPEFLSMMAKRSKSGQNKSVSENASELEKAFKVFDKNGDGKISAKELYSAMATMGEKLSKEEIMEIMADADVDHDGYINIQEFSTLMAGQ